MLFVADVEFKGSKGYVALVLGLYILTWDVLVGLLLFDDDWGVKAGRWSCSGDKNILKISLQEYRSF